MGSNQSIGWRIAGFRPIATTPEHLTKSALDYIDIPSYAYNRQQAEAAQRLKSWFESERMREDIETIPLQEVSGIIDEIGKLFFWDSLRKVSKSSCTV